MSSNKHFAGSEIPPDIDFVDEAEKLPEFYHLHRFLATVAIIMLTILICWRMQMYH